MRCADIRRTHKAPARIEPQRGKVGEDNVESQAKVPCDVFKECESWSYHAKGVADGRPEMTLVVGTLAGTGVAERLTRVATADEVDASGKRSQVQLTQVSAPNRRWIQGLVLHPSQEDGRTEGVPLDIGHHSRMECAADPEVETPDA